ncbi:cyclopropane-fatty-acyl-phospholipid synthase [Gautieria morchelliformis]|nr:cyclopropane-fatty-acyl-phospholipid synthase [Gautieria morchelliformis]
MSLHSTQLFRTSTTHRNSFTGFLDSTWNTATETIAATTSSWFLDLAKSVVIRALNQVEHGELHIVTPTEVLDFGRGQLSPDLKVELRVRRPTFWTRIVFFKELGFAEAFMYGDVDCDDIATLIRLFIANRKNIQLDTVASSMFSAPRLLTSIRFLGDLSNSRANASAHYDLGNTMFSAFLNIRFNPGPGRLETLEAAQMRKMRHIISRADIHKGHRVLEIGSGWGAFSILAVQTTGCTVDTLTLSSEQQELAIKRIQAAGLSDKITVHLMDYRSCKLRPEWEHHFDRLVSIEMMEHVGKDFMETFWDVVDHVLNTDNGFGCVQVTTLPEARVYEYDRGVDFIQKWVIFPGGYIPSCTSLIAGMNSGSGGRLLTESVSNISSHYPRTLREWKRKFLLNFDSLIASTLQAKYNLSDEDLTIFKRKWIYYFDYCEAGFSTRSLGLHIITFTRERNVALGCTWNEHDR